MLGFEKCYELFSDESDYEDKELAKLIKGMAETMYVLGTFDVLDAFDGVKTRKRFMRRFNRLCNDIAEEADEKP